MKCTLSLLLSLASVAALRTPTHATPHLTRRHALSALGSALPLVVPAVCNAEFATELSDERRAVMKASAGAGLFDPNSAFKIECDRDDKECLARKREAANPFKDGIALPSSEKRSADIQRQANGCRITCGANGLRVTCDPGDTECLKKKRESSFIGAGQVPILVGGVLAAIIAQATVLRAPPSENIADAPGMKEYLEGKKKRAALGPVHSRLSNATAHVLPPRHVPCVVLHSMCALCRTRRTHACRCQQRWRKCGLRRRRRKRQRQQQLLRQQMARM